jgi:hypothetical protein
MIAGIVPVIYINGAWDHAAPSIHRAMVIEKPPPDEYTRSVEVPSWRSGHDKEAIRVSRRIHDRTIAGKSLLEVVTKPGRLGFEWVVSKRIIEKESDKPR